MKRKLFSLVLAAVMLVGVLPFSAAADGEIIVQETFETVTTYTKGMAFGGEKATLTCAKSSCTSNPEFVKNTDSTNNNSNTSMKLPDGTNHDIALNDAMTKAYTIAFDFYGEGTLKAVTEMRFMQLQTISKRPISIDTTNGYIMINGANTTLAYTAGHWYHAEVKITMSSGDIPLENRFDATVTDLATGEVATGGTAINNITTPNKLIRFLANYDSTSGGAVYLDNFEIYTGTAGGNLARAALIPNATAYTVKASATETEGTVAVSGGANKNNPYFKTGDTARVTATATEGYTFTSWTATGVELTETQQTANPLELSVAESDVTLTANFSNGSTVTPTLQTAVSPTKADYDLTATATNHKAIAVTLTAADSVTLTAIKNGDTTLTKDTDYTVAGDVYTIATSYLDTLTKGTATLTFVTSDNVNPTVTVTVAESTSQQQTTTIEQNTMDTWATLTDGSKPTEFVSGAANGSYTWSASASWAVDKADNGAIQNNSWKMYATSQPNSLTLTPTNTMTTDWTFAYDFLGTFDAPGGDLDMIKVSGSYVFRLGSDGIFKVAKTTAMTYGESKTNMTYTPNHWYHVEVYMPQTGNATVKLTDTTSNITATTDFPSPNANTRACQKIEIVTRKNIVMYLDNFDLYTGTPDSTRLATPTIAPGTQPPAAGAHTVTVTSANSAQGTATLTSEGTSFEANTAVTVAATAKTDYKFAGWTATGVTLTAEQQTQNPLTFTMPNAEVNLTATFAAKTNASVSPTTATYDKYSESANNVAPAITLTAGDYTLSAIKNGETALTKDTDYTVEGNVYTIAKTYLNTLITGTATLTFVMDGGTNPTAEITIANTTPDLQTYSLTTSADAAQGTVTVSPTGTSFESGIAITATATAIKGYVFSGWTAEGVTLTETQKTAETVTFTMPAGNVTLTAVFAVDETGGAIERNTFEKWTLPSSGTTASFVAAKNGSYKWDNKALFSIDSADDGFATNKSLKIDASEKDTMLTLTLNEAPTSLYTLSFDMIGTDSAYSIGGNMALIRYNDIGAEPLRLGTSGYFKVNGNDTAIAYQPYHWYRITLQVDPENQKTTNAKLTILDVTTNESDTKSFTLKVYNAVCKTIQMKALTGFGTYCIDNIDIYDGAADSTRIALPTVEPGATPVEYYLNVKTAATTGISVQKRVDTADEQALVVSALYDNSTGAPSLADVKMKEVTLKTGETVTLTKDEIVQKPTTGNYSVRYFVLSLHTDGTTMRVLAASK